MKIDRHDAQLDALLGKAVQIEFFDGDVRDGVLGFQEKFESSYRVKPQYYSLYTKSRIDGSMFYISFRKSHVKHIKQI